MIKVGFKKLTDDAILPIKEHASDSGFDLFANEEVMIGPNETLVVPTGIAIGLPEGYEAQVRPRSGVTSKTSLRVQLGTIDNSYTGEIGIIVDNMFQKPPMHGGFAPPKAINGEFMRGPTVGIQTYNIKKGDKLAQLVIQELPQIEAYEIEELPNTERGSAGFGSSGY